MPADEPVYGGKAAGLGRLLAGGARVPSGFAFPAQTETPVAWPEAWREELRARAAPLLAAGAVAVRSSAPGEDAEAKSFAGIFATVLGVATTDGLLDAVAVCIRSGASDQARAYAGDGLAARAVGVVVQAQVEARCAGVCFTVDPAGKDAAVVIEAIAGTGDALVSGRSAPEGWRVYRSGLGGWEARRDPSAGPAVLTAGEAVEIADEGFRFASLQGRPLDLEWARDGRQLWWLQARPVTAFVPARAFDIERPFADVRDGPITVWANWNVRETMPDPLTPLAWSLWRDVLLPAVVETGFGIPASSTLYLHLNVVDLVHGRVYWNMNALLAGPMGTVFGGSMLAHIDTRAAEVTQRLLAAGVLRPRDVPAHGWRVIASFTLRVIGAVLGLGAALRPRHVLRRLDEEAARLQKGPDVSSLSDRALLDEMALFLAPECRVLLRANLMLVVTFVVQAAADALFRGHPRARRLLTAGVKGNPTTRISLAVDDLVEAARPLAGLFAEPLTAAELRSRLDGSAAGVEWVSRLAAFLRFAGQRCPKEFDFATPRWAEDPTMILDLVRAGLSGGAAFRAHDRLDRMGAERREAIEEARRAAPWWRRPLLSAAARLVSAYAPLREAPKHAAMVVFYRMRLAALEIGRRLAARGSLDRAADVMFVGRDAIAAALLAAGDPPDLREAVAAGRARHDRHLAVRPPDFLRSDGVPVEEESAAEPAATDGALRGLGASSGTATGPVRILRTPDPSVMREGDVLVVAFADPGWTPLFPRAGALVMEVGGLMCHAAVVARELGVPAVFGVAGATARLADGQQVRVDGDAGTVTPA